MRLRRGLAFLETLGLLIYKCNRGSVLMEEKGRGVDDEWKSVVSAERIRCLSGKVTFLLYKISLLQSF